MERRYIKLVHADQTHNEWFVVNWCLGNTCNFACSYCPSILHNGSKKWPELEDIKSFILKVKETHPNKKLYFEFTGGEVTLYKNFLEIAQFCKSLGIHIGLISNGSRTLRYWKENKKYFDHICVSFHPEFSKKEHFLDVINCLSGSLRTHVNVMMSPSYFDICKSLVEDIIKIDNISVALQPLIVDFGDQLYDYSEEQMQYINNQDFLTRTIKHTVTFENYRGKMKRVFPDGTGKSVSVHQFISRETNNWQGWNCYAGVEQIIVDMDGSVYRGWCKVGGSIGKIWDQQLQLYDNPVICDKDFCHCNFDIMSTKIKI
jgi:MoaA/NifB/PqqE/SkfB family radical SAM enzyme